MIRPDEERASGYTSAVERTYYVVDVFTSERFAGNPAAVVFDAQGLSDQQMQSIAVEFNLSETTFVTKGAKAGDRVAPEENGCEDRLHFRWFSPTTEVRMCGHATIAGVHALVESHRVPLDEPGRKGALDVANDRQSGVEIETLSGTLAARVEQFPGNKAGRMIWLTLRPPKLEAVQIPVDRLVDALRLPTGAVDLELLPARTQDHDLLFFVQDIIAVNEARPDFVTLARLLDEFRLRGISLATVRTLAPSIAVQSRFFAPCAGIEEDPVTGSVHGPLAAYLAERQLLPARDGTSAMMAVQGKPGARSGLVYALAEKKDGQWSVKIGGQAVTTMKGILFL
jgi:predicted PhzF superfamily epimerase YddE/YHI9